MSTLRTAAAAIALLALAGCDSAANVASRNISQAADNFEITRRIVFYNGITDTYMLTLEGRCSLGNKDTERQRTVTCMTGPNEFKRHFLGLSDNVTYFAEQMDSANVSTYHYRVMFRPQIILPDIDVQMDAGEVFNAPRPIDTRVQSNG
jgi:hypothetical protein